MIKFFSYRFMIILHVATYIFTSIIYIIACLGMLFIPKNVIKKVTGQEDIIQAKNVFVDKGVFH